MQDLSLIPIDDLVEELHKRSDCIVIGYIQGIDKNNESVYINWYGSKFTAIGLGERLINKIHSQIDEVEAQEDGDDA